MKGRILFLCTTLVALSAAQAFTQILVPLTEPDVSPFTATETGIPLGTAVVDTADPVLMAYLWTANPGVPAVQMELIPVATLVQSAATDAASGATAARDVRTEAAPVVPPGVLNNRFYRESLRFKALSVESFEYGDYDAASGYAAEALRFAQLSDEYIAGRVAEARRLAALALADEAIAAARARMDWARGVGADKTYPRQFTAASSSFNEALSARSAENWDGAIAAARRVLVDLADVREFAPLPARYTVRPWAQTRDCFWNISGYSWVYGDPTKWRILYEANRNKLRRPDNPDLLHVGIVLDIPSIAGEVREGLWVPGRTYAPLPRLPRRR